MFNKSKESQDFLSEIRLSGRATPNVQPPLSLELIQNSVQHPGRISLPSTINSKDGDSTDLLRETPILFTEKEPLPEIKSKVSKLKKKPSNDPHLSRAPPSRINNIEARKVTNDQKPRMLKSTLTSSTSICELKQTPKTSIIDKGRTGQRLT